MRLLQFIIYSIVAYAVLRFIKSLLGGPSSKAGANARARRGSRLRKAKSATMVRCENCGTFITESSALMIAGKGFCSEACAEGSKVHRG